MKKNPVSLIAIIVIVFSIGLLAFVNVTVKPKIEVPKTETKIEEPEIETETENRESEVLWDYWLNFSPNGGQGGEIKHFYSGDQLPYKIPSSERIISEADREEVEVLVSRDGYVFKHWNTQEDGMGRSYNPGDFIYNLSEIESGRLFAIWEPEDSGE